MVHGGLYFSEVDIVYELSLGNYCEVGHFLEMGLFKHNEIVAASIFSGHDVSILLQIYPDLINIRNVKRFFTVVDGLSMQLKLLGMFTGEDMLALGSFIRLNDLELYNKMHEAFTINDRSGIFFVEIIQMQLTGDKGLLLVNFSDHLIDFLQKVIKKSMFKDADVIF